MCVRVTCACMSRQVIPIEKNFLLFSVFDFTFLVDAVASISIWRSLVSSPPNYELFKKGRRKNERNMYYIEFLSCVLSVNQCFFFCYPFFFPCSIAPSIHNSQCLPYSIQYTQTHTQIFRLRDIRHHAPFSLSSISCDFFLPVFRFTICFVLLSHSSSLYTIRTYIHHSLNKRIFRSIYFFFFVCYGVCIYVHCTGYYTLYLCYFYFNINAFCVGSIIMSHVKMLRQFVFLC